MSARLAALSGDAATAARWLPIAGTTAPFQLPLAIEVPTITRARVLIAEGGPAALGKAADSLAELLTEYEAHHDTLRTIEVLALQAVACRAQGELEPALATLQRAIDLAAPGGLLRTFVDLGPPMAGLLVELARGREHAAYLAHLLTVFGTTSSPATTAAPDRDEALVLVDRLTDREREVLHLLARRMTYKEIAAELGVSWQTAGKHAGNLYQKLQVSGRRAAVERARRLGLLAGD